ncbi:hypothetical protein [Priestia megaterium]|nr:hypothetical protein [Priestia megaterium]
MTEIEPAMMIKINGGGRGIRTPAGFDTPVGFQDRSLQPQAIEDQMRKTA